MESFTTDTYACRTSDTTETVVTSAAFNAHDPDQVLFPLRLYEQSEWNAKDLGRRANR